MPRVLTAVPLAPPPSRPPPRRALLAGWAVGFGFALLLVVGDVGQEYVETTMARSGRRPPLWRVALWDGIFWGGWALLVPLVWGLVQRFPLTGGRRGRRLLALAAGGVGCFVLHVALQVLAMFLPAYHHVHPDVQDMVEYHTVSSLYLNAITYGVLVALAHALLYYRESRRRREEAARLEAELAQAQLVALRAQLQPHFLFNTLNAISALLHRDAWAADRMLVQLGELLRQTLERADEQEVPLRDEVAFVAKYLEIEQARLGERLSVTLDVAPEVEDALVPSLGLQPLVENAVRHGVASRTAPGHVAVRAWPEAGALRLQVADDGPGLDPSTAGQGVGLAATRERLAHLYGAGHALELRAAEPSGLVVDLRLPLRRANGQGEQRPLPGGHSSPPGSHSSHGG